MGKDSQKILFSLNSSNISTIKSLKIIKMKKVTFFLQHAYILKFFFFSFYFSPSQSQNFTLKQKFLGAWV